MSLSGVPPLLLQLAGRMQQPPTNMASNDEEDEDQMSDCEEMPYIKCEAVYGEDGDDDDEMSALPFVSTEMREDEEECDDKMKFGMKAPEVGAYVKCSVPSCHSYFEVGNPKYEGFSHFKFPEDTAMRRRWIGIIGQKDDWKPEGAMICSNHFAESAFVTLLEHVAETGQLMPKRSLKPGAIPTMNLDIPGLPCNSVRHALARNPAGFRDSVVLSADPILAECSISAPPKRQIVRGHQSASKQKSGCHQRTEMPDIKQSPSVLKKLVKNAALTSPNRTRRSVDQLTSESPPSGARKKDPKQLAMAAQKKREYRERKRLESERSEQLALAAQKKREYRQRVKDEQQLAIEAQKKREYRQRKKEELLLQSGRCQLSSEALRKREYRQRMRDQNRLAVEAQKKREYRRRKKEVEIAN